VWNLGVSHTLKREFQKYLNKNQFSKFDLEKRALQIIFEPKREEVTRPGACIVMGLLCLPFNRFKVRPRRTKHDGWACGTHGSEWNGV
jgi:hypothetical protein